QELLAAVQSRLERHKQLQKYNTEQMEFIRQYINLTLPHELRTPLSGIMGYMYMLEDGFEDMDADTIRNMLGAIKRASTRLSALIENYIAFGQVQLMSNDPELIHKIRQFSNLKDFDSLVYQTTEAVAYKYERMNDVVLDMERGDVHIYFDHAKKLIDELVDNAFKFSKAGTPIHVTGKHHQDCYVLMIEDRGRGMTTEQISQIGVNQQFEREQYEQQGAGLGLAISEKIMSIYQGELRVESEPQVGTTVSLIFQLA
ncbi:MAG: HAMP domain-containing sensor histidine kinase, partial [Chloroflexota bacterium]